MRDEWSSGGTALLQIQNRCFNFEIAAFTQDLPDRTDRSKSNFENATCIGVNRQIDITLSVAGVDIGQSLPLIGERT